MVYGFRRMYIYLCILAIFINCICENKPVKVLGSTSHKLHLSELHVGGIRYIKYFKWTKASSYGGVAAGNATKFLVICCLISFCLPGSCCRNFNLSGGLFTQGPRASWDQSCRMQAESNCLRHADIELVECLELILAKFPFFFFFFFL